MPPKNKLLIIGLVWPEPTSSAAGSRMMQLIRLFKDHGWQITFASAANPSQYMADLDNLGIGTETIHINNQSFDQLLKNINPEVVLFDRFITEEQFGWRVHATLPEAVRILDMEDLHCLRFARQIAVHERRESTPEDLFSDLAKREIASVYRSDLSLVISESEMDLLITFFGIDPKLLFYLPYLLDPIRNNTLSDWPTFESRAHFISIGNFRHKPNMDSIIYLKEELWPSIHKELHDAELHIYGAYPSKYVKQFNDPTSRFLVKGRAEDAKSVLKNARVCLAPLRFGAGLKGKLTEAMQCGTPSITTTIGAEGINGKLEWPGHISDDPEEFIKASVRFYTDSEIWGKAQQRGIEIINQRFSPQLFSQSFLDRLQELQQEIDGHRQNNFTGAMLLHHTMASTRFMSRWIEEKNKTDT